MQTSSSDVDMLMGVTHRSIQEIIVALSLSPLIAAEQRVTLQRTLQAPGMFHLAALAHAVSSLQAPVMSQLTTLASAASSTASRGGASTEHGTADVEGSDWIDTLAADTKDTVDCIDPFHRALPPLTLLDIGTFVSSEDEVLWNAAGSSVSVLICNLLLFAVSGCHDDSV